MSFAKVFSSIVHQIATGTPIWKITVPASIHTDKSGLQVQSNRIMNNGECLDVLAKIDSTSDPIERIGLIIQGILNPHEVFVTDKPFNPVQGEFVSVSTTVGSGVYHLDVEQIWHHPPVTSFCLKGPNFKMYVPMGVDPTGGVKPGLNHMEFAFPNSVVHFETSQGTIEFCWPGFRLDNLIFGKRTAGVHGDWWVKDSSGIRFEGKITAPYKLKGELIGADGAVIDSVEGDMHKGVFFKKSKKLFTKGVESQQSLSLIVDEATLKDPQYSENVWGGVFKYMRMSPPDYDNADKGKGIVEQKQRDDMKARNNQYTSRFGFQCKQMTETLK